MINGPTSTSRSIIRLPPSKPTFTLASHPNLQKELLLFCASVASKISSQIHPKKQETKKKKCKLTLQVSKYFE